MTAEMIRKACVDLFVCMSATVHPHQILISSTVRNAVNTATMTEQFFLSSQKWTKPPDSISSVCRGGEVEWIL